ncbi:tryptophan halogenase family protein [Ideonella sp.]|uniref:tryptophan halogenase family protein n=1 Tax=Ideonella sp. TaxID=1929293 RepID=UPI003BB65BC4
MNDERIRRVVIVGGGTAGWMSAAPLARLLRRPGDPQDCEVVLVESADIGTIGVGEATLPTIVQYNQSLGLDPVEFLRRTRASFKLGIEFKDWGTIGHRFFHGFGDFGPPIEGLAPWQHWLRLNRAGGPGPAYEDGAMAAVMARGNRFVPPQTERASPVDAYAYAFHFDAGLYAAFLREKAQGWGVERIEGTIVEVERRAEDGFVAALRLADGRRIEGDLFIDCSGLRALLIEGEMQAGFEDWSAMLPCNSALAVPCERVDPLTPYTVSAAKAAGWTWRIPLQHRTGNGHVYCDGFTSHEDAAQVLLAGLDGKALDTPRPIRFTTGRRRRSWVKNVVAIGLSAGFLEPLESTSIHLILDNIGRLIHLFPDRRCEPALAAEFNRLADVQFEAIRDFIILHYKLTRRTDSEFWRYCADMPIPDTLAAQIELFKRSGRVSVRDPNGFLEPSWVSIYLGLGLRPERWDPRVDRVDEGALRRHFSRLRQGLSEAAAAMPLHGDFIEHQLEP